MQGDFDFTDDEIRLELGKLGYGNVPHRRLAEFREDLKKLVAHESRSTNSASSSFNDTSTGQLRTPRSSVASHKHRTDVAQDKENVGTNMSWSSKDGYSSHQQMSQAKTFQERTLPASKRQRDDYIIPDSMRTGNRRSMAEVHEWAEHHVPFALQAARQSMRTLRSASPSHESESKTGSQLCPLSSDEPTSQRFDYGTVAAAAEEQEEEKDAEEQPSYIKRKVLRKRGGKTEVCDESTAATISDVENMSALSERLSRMPTALNELAASPCERIPTAILSEHQPTARHGRASRVSSQVLAAEQRQSATRIGVRGSACRSSVIIAADSRPPSASAGRTDPVRRHLEYERVWAAQRTSEERQQKGLRWQVRERMLVRDVVYQKRQWQYEPNAYEVPTSKQRKALRWQVRTDMAHGTLPSTGRKA